MRGCVRPQTGAAFTLVELLIGAALSGAIMAAVLSTYIFLGRSLGRLANQQTIENEGRIALGYFANDIQVATGIAGTPTAASLTLNTPSVLGYSSITYSYNSDPENESVVTINGTTLTVAVPAHTLMRSVYNSTANTVTSRELLRNISDGDAGTTIDLRLRYYDGAGSAFDSGPPSYTLGTIYAPGIKMLSLSFGLQTGNAGNGTQTPVSWVSSGQVALRNRALLQ